jgi:hypothetical protein
LNCCLYLRINHFYYHEYALFLANKTIKHKLPHHQGIDKYLFIVYSISMLSEFKPSLEGDGILDAEYIQGQCPGRRVAEKAQSPQPIIVAS